MQYLIFNGNKVLIQKVQNKFALPTIELLKNLDLSITEICQFANYKINIFNSVNDTNTTSTPSPQISEELEFINLRTVFNNFTLDTAREISYAKQLIHYYLTHKYCGTCGTQTVLQSTNKFVFCPNCKAERYPHIAPCIIVRIHKDDKILMAQGVEFPPNVWGLIAGFVEVGESLEEAVMREVKEEVGIEITDIKYWNSQPWPFPDNSLMVGFTAQYLSGTITPDKTEIANADFFTRDNIPGTPSTNISIAACMIEEFRNKS